MAIKENDEILIREKDQNIQNILKRYSYYVEQAVNYGTHILLWPYKEDRPELNVIKLYLRYFLDMLDAVSVLIKAGSAEPAKSLLRSAFEINLSIHFIYDKNTSLRADAFWVVEKINQLKELEKMNPKGKAYKQAKNNFSKESIINFGSGINGKNIRAQIKEVEEYLKSPELQSAVDEYNRIKQGKSGKIYWYNLFDGVDSIESMARVLNKYTFYEILYRHWSKAVHGNNIMKDKIYFDRDGNSYLVPLRHPVHLAWTAKMACNLAINTFGYYVQRSYPERIEEYNNWQAEFTGDYEIDLGHEYITG
ncbi:MAG TPA: DUF5677 domain-containing protein [Mucilaginibacter sp.]